MKKSLYERLGGIDAITAVVNEFGGRLFTDEQLGVFFFGWGDERKRVFAERNISFIAHHAGGSEVNTARPLEVVYKGMNLTQGDYNRFIVILKEVLAKFNVPENETQEILALQDSYVNIVVERPNENKTSKDASK